MRAVLGARSRHCRRCHETKSLSIKLIGFLGASVTCCRLEEISTSGLPLKCRSFAQGMSSQDSMVLALQFMIFLLHIERFAHSA